MDYNNRLSPKCCFALDIIALYVFWMQSFSKMHVLDELFRDHFRFKYSHSSYEHIKYCIYCWKIIKYSTPAPPVQQMTTGGYSDKIPRGATNITQEFTKIKSKLNKTRQPRGRISLWMLNSSWNKRDCPSFTFWTYNNSCWHHDYVSFTIYLLNAIS